MAREQSHSADTKPEQKAALSIDPHERESDVVLADPVRAGKEYLADLAMAEEPVTIRLEPQSGDNAPRSVPVWCNGKGCEVWDERNKRWYSTPDGHIPVGVELTVKRKYVAILASSKQDRIKTTRTGPEDIIEGRPNNMVERITSQYCSFSIIEDRNPRGRAWLTELLRRNY